MKKILLYYKYAFIEDPEDLKNRQIELCQRLNIKGRILLSDEGYNGTVSGEEKDIKEYMIETEKYPGLKGTEWKMSDTEIDAFPRLRVVVRDEVVTLGLRREGDDVNLTNTADYIEPKELEQLFDTKEDFIIVDARNDYETKIGKFKDAFEFDVKNFREIPENLHKLEKYKNKKIVTYCTGGVRCEKFSAYLKENGFEDVKQLHGGIQRYYEQTGGKNFEGEMYVFDNRVHINVNDVNPVILTSCEHCGKELTRYINCANAECNIQFTCCEDCETKFEGACSEECIEQGRVWKVKKVEKQARRQQGVSNPKNR